MTILGTTASSEGEEGFLRTCFGLAFMTSEARMVPAISSTWPLQWTILMTSRDPHGSMQEMQHLMAFFMGGALDFCLGFSWVLVSHKERREVENENESESESESERVLSFGLGNFV